MGHAERAALERWNLYNDRRVTEAMVNTGLTNINTRNRTAEFVTSNDEDEPVVHAIGLRWEVCHVCQGDGTHADPSYDAGGVHPDDFDEPEEFRRYLRGEYDVKCGTCNGRTTVPVPCESRTEPEAWAAYQAYLRGEREFARECALERALGC